VRPACGVGFAQAMELLLWRWSTAVQASSLATLALFFFALSRSVRLDEVRTWSAAWAWNLAALLVTLAHWHFQPGPAFFRPTSIAYALTKVGFVLLLVQGAYGLKHPGRRLWSRRTVAPALLLYAVVIGLFAPTIDHLGRIHHAVLAVLLAAGAWVIHRRPRVRGLNWLVAGLGIRAVLALGETAAFALQFGAAASTEVAGQVRWFLAAASSFDQGAEWLLALGCVIALSERVQRDLRQANEGLLAAQEDLRRLADRDPLTALANRRQLPEALRAVQPAGAQLLFFDLDGFKQINDRYGHHVGDECLKRFAEALRECFRPGDTLVRYAGDEFLVVAGGLDEVSARGRVETLRERLLWGVAGGPPVRFSVGLAALPAGGVPEDAVQAADAAMYAAKASAGRARRRA
jgi:diguanylate cyclase (GGDEF)-like protein